MGGTGLDGRWRWLISSLLSTHSNPISFSFSANDECLFGFAFAIANSIFIRQKSGWIESWQGDTGIHVYLWQGGCVAVHLVGRLLRKTVWLCAQAPVSASQKKMGQAPPLLCPPLWPPVRTLHHLRGRFYRPLFSSPSLSLIWKKEGTKTGSLAPWKRRRRSFLDDSKKGGRKRRKKKKIGKEMGDRKLGNWRFKKSHLAGFYESWARFAGR